MATKMTGAQFKAFYNDPATWAHEGEAQAWFIDDMAIKVNGKEFGPDATYDAFGQGDEEFVRLPDDAEVSVTSGYFGWQGKGAEPGRADMSTEAKRWLKLQNTAIVVVEVNKTDPVRAAIGLAVMEALGGKLKGVPTDFPTLSEAQQATLRAHLQALTQALTPATPAPTDTVAPRAKRRPGR